MRKSVTSDSPEYHLRGILTQMVTLVLHLDVHLGILTVVACFVTRVHD